MYLKIKNSSYLVIILLLILLNGILIYFNKQKTQSIKMLQESFASLNDLRSFNRDLLTDIFFSVIQSEGVEISKDLELINSAGRKISITSIVHDNSPKIVFNFSNYNCKTCIGDEILRLSKISEVIGKDNVIFISKYDNLREMYVLEKKLKIPILNIPGTGFNLPVDKQFFPYIFVLEKDLVANDIYIPTKEFFKLGDEYLSAILQKYFNSKSI